MQPTPEQAGSLSAGIWARVAVGSLQRGLHSSQRFAGLDKNKPARSLLRYLQQPEESWQDRLAEAPYVSPDVFVYEQ